jgi:hypothetical protein
MNSRAPIPVSVQPARDVAAAGHPSNWQYGNPKRRRPHLMVDRLRLRTDRRPVKVAMEAFLVW